MSGLFRFDGEASVGDQVELSEAESHHISVRRLLAGEQITLTDGEQRQMTGVIAGNNGRRVVVEIQSIESVPSRPLRFVLVQALAKGDRDELAIQAATELGVANVIPWQADRSVSRWQGAKVEKQRERWQAICDEASKQSLQTRFVKVQELLDSKQLAAEIAIRGGTWLVLEPSASQSLTNLDLLSQGEIFIIVGPEGGITQDELNAFQLAGATLVKLGEGVLRTSTAGIAALSFLAGKTGMWN